VVGVVVLWYLFVVRVLQVGFLQLLVLVGGRLLLHLHRDDVGMTVDGVVCVGSCVVVDAGACSRPTIAHDRLLMLMGKGLHLVMLLVALLLQNVMLVLLLLDGTKLLLMLLVLVSLELLLLVLVLPVLLPVLMLPSLILVSGRLLVFVGGGLQLVVLLLVVLLHRQINRRKFLHPS
jgi:hypothetical protein